jgi:hypothetical protein
MKTVPGALAREQAIQTHAEAAPGALRKKKREEFLSQGNSRAYALRLRYHL